MKREGAKFVRYFGPLLDALRSLGGSGTPQEVASVIAQKLNVSETEQSELLKSGTPRFLNQVQWARQYLRMEGYIDSSKRGVWVLTPAGQAARLSDSDARNIFLNWVAHYQQLRKKNQQSGSREDAPDDLTLQPQNHRETLLSILKRLPPSGFENLCKRLLREAGFASVEVTGRSGDGGIDGNGVLELNPFVTFKVLFQCKRFAKTVSPSYVREFQGAIGGRADKGIILTTGSFSIEARKEAVRDGAAPIELVDGEKLVEMFERLELGLRPKTVYEIDAAFFDTYTKT
jgi:restriction system protein